MPIGPIKGDDARGVGSERSARIGALVTDRRQLGGRKAEGLSGIRATPCARNGSRDLPPAMNVFRTPPQVGRVGVSPRANLG